MADGFQPSFVDLVRNYTTTVGTDDFVLGPAVNGFSSFADACRTGDSFYYSATGVDTPAETEVGRGTLNADGTIARDPLSGVKTNFSSGTKSIALVASGEWFGDVETVRSSTLNVKMFGAKGDAVLAADGTIASGTDDTASIQAAIDHIDSLGGGTLHFPRGNYLITAYVRLCKNLRIIGAGRESSCIVTYLAGGGGATPAEGLRNGSAFYSGWDNGPPSTSNPVQIAIEQMGFTCWNGANDGAAFYDSNGTNIQLKHCCFNGFKYGVVLDYSELVDIEYCDFEFQNGGGAGLWIVNGPTLDPTHATAATNRISVSRSQINQVPTTYGVLDDGGYAHSFIDDNFNGCLSHIYAAGVQGLQVIGGEFEAASAQSIEITYLRGSDGGGVGGCTGHFLGMMNSTSTAGQPCIHITSVSGPISVRGCVLIRTDMGVPITGANNAGAGLFLSANYSNSNSGEIVDGFNAGYFSDDRVDLPVRTNSGLAAFDLAVSYAKKFVRCTNVAGNACTIRNDSTILLPTGTTFYLEQSAAGPVSLIADTGVTITGPTATTTQYQRLVVRKRSANSWQSELVMQNPLTQAITPKSVAATGAVTTTTGGIGYSAGAGGTVVQGTSKSTGVTLNKLSGQITMNAAQLAPSTIVSFALTNSQIAAGDILVLNHVSGGTAGAYALNAQCGAGTALVTVRNASAVALSEAIVIGFALIKSVTQ